MIQQASRKALGRGLSSLLDDIAEEAPTDPNAAPTPGSSAMMTPIELIAPNRNQPRKYFDENDLKDLTESIKAKGVIQPILVRPLRGKEGRYEIVAGERRWRAAQRASLHEVPIVVRELGDTEALEIAIIENVQRADLNPMEEAYGYRQLIEKYGYTQDELAKNVGKSRSHIANMMRFMSLPGEVQDMLREGKLSMGHARPLIGAEDPVSLAKQISKKGLSARQAEKLAKRGSHKGEIPSQFANGGKRASKDANTLLMEGGLSAALRMEVTINPADEQTGELVIRYRTLDDLEKVCQILTGETEREPLLASG